MKHLILLLALLAPLAAQSLTNTTLDGVTNATINGVLDNDSAATRTALGLGTAATENVSFINVKSAPYSAAGDGTTDDTNAINLASIALNAAGGGVLYFPRGTYMVRQSTITDMPWSGSGAQVGPRPCFRVFSNMTLAGDGYDVTIIKNITGSIAGPMIHINNAVNFTMRGVTLDGNYPVGDASLAGGDYEGLDTKEDVRNMLVEKCRFTNIGNEAIDLDWPTTAPNSDGFEITVRDCLFENILGEGIHNATWTLVENCQFRNVGHGRWFALTYGSGSAQGNAAIDGGGENLIVRNCHFVDCSTAVGIYANIGSKGRATGLATFTGQPTVGETISVGGRTYTWAGASKAVTAATSDTFTSTSHGLADATPVRFVVLESGGGVSRGVTYYIRDSAASTFKLAATAGGAAIDITAAIAAGAWISSDWPTTNEVAIGATYNDTAKFLSHTVNGMFSWATKNANVTATYAAPSAATGSPAVVQFSALVAGTDGNSTVFTEASSSLTISGAGTLAGGGTRNGTTASSALIVDGCVIESNQALLAAIGSEVENTIITNTTFRVSGIAVSLHGINSKVTNCTITQPFVHGADRSIQINGNGSVIQGCFISGYRVHIYGVASVIGNTINSRNQAIYCEGAAVDNVKIIGNLIDSTVLTNINGSANTDYPIAFATSGQTGAIVSGNTVVCASQRGIDIQSEATVTGNVLSGAISHGIYLNGNSSTCTGNRITVSGSYGITAAGTGNTITGNWASAPAGIVNNSGVNNMLVGNIGTGSPLHLYRSGTPESVVTGVIGSTCMDTATGSLYRKTSGTGNTGWVTP
jgi:hypothetical protein